MSPSADLRISLITGPKGLSGGDTLGHELEVKDPNYTVLAKINKSYERVVQMSAFTSFSTMLYLLSLVFPLIIGLWCHLSGVADSKSYILTSQLPPDLYEKYVVDANTAYMTGFTFVIISIVHLAGGKIPEGMIDVLGW